MPRETFIMELNCETPVGTNKEGQERLIRYMNIQAQLLNEKPLIPPRTHRSPLYGLSGWAPLPDSAIHVYAWDHETQKEPPFVSVDISRDTPLTEKQKRDSIWMTMDLLRGRKGEIVHKTSTAPSTVTWRELAPNIVRQRLSIAGRPRTEITESSMSNFMEALSEKLNMSQLSSPLIHENNAWMHWETSGTIASWDNEKPEVDIDVYTCKKFSPEEAILYTREQLRLIDIKVQNY